MDDLKPVIGLLLVGGWLFYEYKNNWTDIILSNEKPQVTRHLKKQGSKKRKQTHTYFEQRYTFRPKNRRKRRHGM